MYIGILSALAAGGLGLAALFVVLLIRMTADERIVRYQNDLAQKHWEQ